MGLPLAAVFAKNGADVTVCDINASLVASINGGHCPYEEPGLPELMKELRVRGRLTASTETRTVAAAANAIVIIVPAHLTAQREIDLTILKSASADVGGGLAPGALVIYETTVSMGATRSSLIPALEQASGLRAGQDFSVGYSPERVKANLVLDRLETTPKVVGGFDDRSSELTALLYERYLTAPVERVGSLEAAEMTKLVGMLYRDVNIALANELAAYCERAGVDFKQVRRAANRDGEASLLEPGIGVGGHCTPVYPYFLMRDARRLGVAQHLAELAREINDAQPARQLQRVARVWRALAGIRVHVLGLGFRPGVKVDTFSPAYALRDELLRLGALVTIEDPYYSAAELRSRGFAPGSVLHAPLVVLNTAHEEFKDPDFRQWRIGGTAAILDGRGLWCQADAEAAGLVYFGVGCGCEIERKAATSDTFRPTAVT
jgi:nucleotide sugar dehydrogenase